MMQCFFLQFVRKKVTKFKNQDGPSECLFLSLLAAMSFEEVMARVVQSIVHR